MPAAYEAMRDDFKKQGMGDKAAKGKAARIFNAKRKPGQAPVTRGSDKPKSKKEALHEKVKAGLKRAFPSEA